MAMRVVYMCTLLKVKNQVRVIELCERALA